MLFRSFSQTKEDHLKHIKIVAKALLHAGLKLQFSKVSFFKTSVELLGRHIDRHGIRISKKHTNAMKRFPRPEDKMGLLRFLGLTTYCSTLVMHYSQKIVPLVRLLRKGVAFIWDDACEAAFNQLKEDIVTGAQLAFIDPGETVYVATDAKIGRAHV